ncbi:nucleoside deaminase [Nocardioides sp. T5]|uniref:nucleoside deaminase n=1 Tax=Nocardioides sp. T5 TaxID=3400182 RepID=UPI003A8B9248
MMIDPAEQTFLDLAIEQARIGWQEGGIPIGAALVHEGEVLAVGRNRRVQMGSAIRHGETDCLENAGRLPARVYRASTLYTTLSPCFMCAGTAVLYDIPRIVIGENRTFEASESWLTSRGVELVVADDEQCRSLMDTMIAEKPELWAEDIGEEA